MRFFAQGETALTTYPLPMKIALSFFVIFVLLGLASSLALYHNQFGFDLDRASRYYQGNRGGEDAQQFYVKKSFRQLLEVTHFHLYIMPVVYLAFIHLYFLSGRPSAEKTILCLTLFSGLLLEVSTPWLVRYGSGEWVPLFWVSGFSLTVPTLWMACVCLGELWIRSRTAT